MNEVEVSQTILKKAGFYTGDIDGDFGKNSVIAARKYYDFEKDWKPERILIGVIQVYAVRNNIPTGGIDGYWGNNTSQAYPQVLSLLGIEHSKNNKIDQNIIINPKYNNWPKQKYSDMVNFYGKVGTNQTSLTIPYEMKLAWDLNVKISKITCHSKVKDSLERIFKNTLDHYGLENIRDLRLDIFGGCLNVRKMRGGSSWSIHSWGAAIDLDPDRNQLRWGKDKAVFAKVEYEPFWKIVEAEGWTSLGREKNMDYMHFQAAYL